METLFSVDHVTGISLEISRDYHLATVDGFTPSPEGSQAAL